MHTTKYLNARTTLGRCRLDIRTTEGYVLNFDSDIFHLWSIVRLVHPSQKATKRNKALVPRHWLTTPVSIYWWVWNVTEKGSRWFRVATTSILGRSEAGDILLDSHFERRIGLRTAHSNTSELNIWPHTWIYLGRWQIDGIGMCFTGFLMVRAELSQRNKLVEDNYQTLGQWMISPTQSMSPTKV